MVWEKGRIRDLGSRFNHRLRPGGREAHRLHSSILPWKNSFGGGRIHGSEAVDVDDGDQIVGNVRVITFSEKDWPFAILWTRRR